MDTLSITVIASDKSFSVLDNRDGAEVGHIVHGPEGLRMIWNEPYQRLSKNAIPSDFYGMSLTLDKLVKNFNA